MYYVIYNEKKRTGIDRRMQELSEVSFGGYTTDGYQGGYWVYGKDPFGQEVKVYVGTDTDAVNVYRGDDLLFSGAGCLEKLCMYARKAELEELLDKL